MSAEVVCGDCRTVMAEMAANSIDAIVCDPPYMLTSGKHGGSGAASVNLDSPYGRARIGTGNGPGGFMNQKWDVPDDPTPQGAQAWHESWAREALRVLKPGAYCLAFGGTRTHHRLVCALEDAGFEIRDSITYIHGQGFPKSLNLGNGYGTALKPAHEPIVVARKPLIGNVAANVAAYGTGALNIDGCRLGTEPRATGTVSPHAESGVNGIYGRDPRTDRQQRYDANKPAGRWPPNVCLDEEAAALVDAASGERRSGVFATRARMHRGDDGSGWRHVADETPVAGCQDGDTGGPSRFFYVAKASRAERNAGLDSPSSHPTVKPVALMRWLVRLVTPPDGTLLDPFLGSGTTLMAALLEGMHGIGIEQSEEYVAIARRRIAHVERHGERWLEMAGMGKPDPTDLSDLPLFAEEPNRHGPAPAAVQLTMEAP